MSADWYEPRWGVDADAGPDAGWTSASEWHLADDAQDPSDDAIDVLEREYAEIQQIRSKDRVRDLAEVFTNQREIAAMLDLMPDAFSHLDIKFLEPACGSGNFMVEILRRKLALVTRREAVSQDQYEHRILRGVASIYGIDISPENIAEAHVRMAHVVLEHFRLDGGAVEPTIGFLAAVNVIVHANIIEADSLGDPWSIEMCDWQPRAAGRFQRVWSAPLVPEDERGLLWFERTEDARPVHYSKLATVAATSAKEMTWT